MYQPLGLNIRKKDKIYNLKVLVSTQEVRSIQRKKKRKTKYGKTKRKVRGL